VVGRAEARLHLLQSRGELLSVVRNSEQLIGSGAGQRLQVFASMLT
jgi:hypothetical protein